jgi:N-acetylglucosamine-6-sulfatase
LLAAGVDPSWRTPVLLERLPTQRGYRAVRTETHKYVEYNNGEVELYDLQADPYELNNIYESADSALLEDLKAKLEALKSCSEDRCREAEDAS